MTMTRRPIDRPAQYRNAIERLLGEWPLVPMQELTEIAPPLDVRETDDAWIVELDLPGQDPDDIEVLIEGRTLTVRGRTQEEAERREGEYLLRERRRGQFVRALTLPGMVEVDKVTSRVENGELIINLPKAAQNRARRIEVGGSSQARPVGSGSGRPVATQSSGGNGGSRQPSDSAAGQAAAKARR